MQQAISSKRGVLKGLRGAILALTRTRITFTSDLNIDLTKTHAANASFPSGDLPPLGECGFHAPEVP
ncbi:hypothetical protein TNCV_241101 [Trichonephila clavipes]|nr:hypothetical protein TNCV_241101 [Trichonephila clavipes]